VVCGPQTIQLDYDQILEELQMSTGRPKTTDALIHTVYLRHENNKVSDLVCVETKDFVKCYIKVSYCVDFLKEYVDKWFNVENYVKYLCDRIRSELKRAAKEYTIEDFYQNYSTIVRNIAIAYNENNSDNDGKNGRFFSENGMLVHDCEVLSISIDDEIAEMLKEHQQEMIAQSLKLTDAEKRMVIAQQLALTEKEEQELRSQQLLNKLALQRTEALKKLEIQAEVNRKNEAEQLAAKQAEKDMQTLVDVIHEAELVRQEKDNAQTIEYEKQKAEIEKSKQDAYAATVAKITAIAESVAPYAIAQDESISTVVNKMTRGLPIEDILKNSALTTV
jgi:major vault protein